MFQIIQFLEKNTELDWEETENSLSIQFPDQSVFLLNLYAPMEQIWISYPTLGGRHFIWHDDRWIDTKNGRELMQTFHTILSQYLIK